ncbi:MAG TPA: DUF1127 domain-containing protein [Beijerinckiaceae bacterium]|jgi:uncharacterized protein YjiS (DUF1127 family)
MSVSLLSAHSPGSRRDGALREGVARMLARAAAALVERLAHERRVAHDVRYLNSFDDRMLADIGLSRCEIETFVRRRAGARPWR